VHGVTRSCLAKAPVCGATAVYYKQMEEAGIKEGTPIPVMLWPKK